MAIEANCKNASCEFSKSNFNRSTDLTFSNNHLGAKTCPECLSHEGSLMAWFPQVSCSSISPCLFPRVSMKSYSKSILKY